MYKKLLDDLRPELEKTVQFLKSELVKIKTSRATPAMVEDIEIDCYNQKFPVKQLATINVPQSRLITIQPWDKAILQDIERGIRNNSGFSPVVDGDLIRINIPALNEEQRKEYCKVIADKSEEARISTRLHRERVWKGIQEMEKKGEIREDDKFRAKDDLQELIDDYNQKIEEMKKNKESEVMTV
ncbi:MAG: ribosome recycling factor [Candidatus Portnoybacteria bacterium CG10_big_fil_rev_8_21_14_0_10_38_18]|uniref:Ribosome-recycling factor n=1 Tax=Candidatus Portnoybacteria bacterium CG10_big_fil_rev_8_21_14_0_10_38_18 TaxID=1974813 RepID=A0A2M8KC43_9BACT|nr:MAG: ribosome recycling factor [Candidatus Portnoybacteria bacterium CG10_big_fil_rev_8_21_14_0_10_38_18]